MSQISQSVSEILAGPGDDRRRQSIVEAAMAASALVAMADGEVSFSERVLVDQAIEALTADNDWEAHDLMAIFNDFADAIAANSSQGRRPALSAIGALEDMDDVGDAVAVVLRIARAVAAADGAATESERAAIDEIAEELNALTA